MKDNYYSLLLRLKENPNIKLIDDFIVEYRELQPITLELDVEELEDEGWVILKDQHTYLNLSGLSIGWESALKGVDMTLTGGFTLNSLTDALTMSSSFWKGAFSLAPDVEVPEHLRHFEQLGWFSKQAWDDGRYGCFIKQPGNFPPPIAFYSRGWCVKLEMTFEEYLENMFKMYGAKGWQFFFIEPTTDMTYKEDILTDMRVITEQFPLLFPENDWSFLVEKHEQYKKVLG